MSQIQLRLVRFFLAMKKPPPPDTPIQDDPYRQLAAKLIDRFENLLDEKGMKVPSDDRDGDETEGCIYGAEYYDLEEAITADLKDRVIVP